MKNKEKMNPKHQIGGPYGRVYASWDFSERSVAWQNPKWTKWAILLGGTILIYALITFNFLFAVIIVMVGIIFFFQSLEKPLRVHCQVTEDGIIIGKKLYEYRELDNFWIIYEPPEVKALYLEFKNVVRPRLGISLENENPLIIRNALKQYLRENIEREHEPFSDGLARWFNLHH